MACNHELSTEIVASDLMQYLDAAYSEALHDSQNHLLQKWVSAMRILGTRVKIRHAGGQAAGCVETLSFDELRLDEPVNNPVSLNLSHVQAIELLG
jgi:hypothetical protein